MAIKRQSMPNLGNLGCVSAFADICYSSDRPLTAMETRAARKPRAFSARSYRSSTSGTVRYAYFQDVVELAKVSANFAVDLDSQYSSAATVASTATAAATAATTKGVTMRKYHSEIAVDRVGLANGLDTSDTESDGRRRVGFRKVPTMLLPSARPRGRSDFFDYVNGLKDNSVIANDPRSQMIVTSQSAKPPIAPRPKSAVSTTTVVISESDSSESGAERTQRSLSLPQQSYIDTFADFRSIVNDNAGKRRKRNKRRNRVDCSDGIDDPTCPQCLQLMRKLGGKKQLIEWINRGSALVSKLLSCE